MEECMSATVEVKDAEMIGAVYQRKNLNFVINATDRRRCPDEVREEEAEYPSRRPHDPVQPYSGPKPR